MVRIRYAVQRLCIMNLFDHILKCSDESARGLLGTNNRLLPANHRFFPPNYRLLPANETATPFAYPMIKEKQAHYWHILNNHQARAKTREAACSSIYALSISGPILTDCRRIIICSRPTLRRPKDHTGHELQIKNFIIVGIIRLKPKMTHKIALKQTN